MSENNTAPDSMKTARAKLQSVLEIYTPMHLPGRANAVAAIAAALTEFEAAVREDERAQLAAVAAAAAIDNETSEANAQAPAPAPTVVPVHDETLLNPKPLPILSQDEGAAGPVVGNDANGSPVVEQPLGTLGVDVPATPLGGVVGSASAETKFDDVTPGADMPPGAVLPLAAAPVVDPATVPPAVAPKKKSGNTRK